MLNHPASLFKILDSVIYGAFAKESRLTAFFRQKVSGAGFFSGRIAAAVSVNPLFATLRYLTTGI